MALIGALVLVSPFVGLAGLIVFVLTAEAALDWNGSALRDWVAFRAEQRLEGAINRAIRDDTRPIGEAVVLSDVVSHPMRRACIVGKRANWWNGPIFLLMRQSYRPVRRPPFDDYHDTKLVIEFADGRVLGIFVPLDRYTVHFSTVDPLFCAAGGKIAFVREPPASIRIRSD